MIELLTANTPNGKKISIMLEEINFKYKVTKINIDKGVNLMLKIISDWNDAPVWTPKKIKKATKTWFERLSRKK